METNDVSNKFLEVLKNLFYYYYIICKRNKTFIYCFSYKK